MHKTIPDKSGYKHRYVPPAHPNKKIKTKNLISNSQ